MEALADAALALFSLPNLLALVVGCVIGMAFGLTPGLDATSGTAVLVAFTFGMPAEAAILLLLGLYTCATYAGSITAICIGVPGTAASAATMLDGHAMTKRGEAGRALSIAAVASCVGGLAGTVALILIAAPLARFAVSLGSAEYFALTVFALTIVASLVGGSWVKGMLAVSMGLLLTTVGLDPFTAFPRFTFGIPELVEGISYIPALIGLFAISEALHLAESALDARQRQVPSGGRLVSWVPRQDWPRLGVPLFVGSVGGTFIGALPGIGAAAGNWITYNEARRFSRRPDEFGKGSPEGIAASESGNNATVSSALIPLLTLAIPGSPTAAVILGAFVIHGLQPGPRMFSQETELINLIFAGLLLANVLLLVLGLVGTRLWVSALRLPTGLIVAVIFTMALIGAYALRNSMFDVWLMLGFGVVGHLLRKAGVSAVPLVLGLVLGDLLQDNFRRALIASPNGLLTFLERPVSATFLGLAVLSLAAAVWRDRRTRCAGDVDEPSDSLPSDRTAS